VHAAALNPAHWHILRGDPLVTRLMGVGLTRPKSLVAGIDAAGVVEAAGANVRGPRTGEEVLGFCRGAFPEYACAAADMMVPKPASLTFEQAAAVPIAATTWPTSLITPGPSGWCWHYRPGMTTCAPAWTISSSQRPGPPWCCCGARVLLTSLLNAAPPARQPPVARRLDRAEELGAGNFPVIWQDAAGGETG
jgi:hypothetical protein